MAKRVGGMAGRQARIFDGPAEGSVDEGIRAALDQRPGSPDEALDDGDAQARQTNRQDQKSEPHRDCGEHALGHAGQRRRGQHRNRRQRQRERNDNPDRLAEIGQFIEDCIQPFRHAPRHADGGGVEQQHRRRHDARSRAARRRRDEAGCAISASRHGLGLRPKNARYRESIGVQPLQPHRRCRRDRLLELAAHAHDRPTERKTAMVICCPVLILIASMRGPLV